MSGTINIPNHIEGEMVGVRRAIMKEIQSAKTWHDVLGAVRALENARRIHDDIAAEAARNTNGVGSVACSSRPASDILGSIPHNQLPQ